MVEAIIKILKNDHLMKSYAENNYHDFKKKFDILLVAQSISSIYQKLVQDICG
jgi:glycosyltransferase involved in cell wall biosynthesis